MAGAESKQREELEQWRFPAIIPRSLFYWEIGRLGVTSWKVLGAALIPEIMLDVKRPTHTPPAPTTQKRGHSPTCASVSNEETDKRKTLQLN